MELERCYVFDAADARPNKKRKVEKQSVEASLQVRKETYQNCWRKQEHHIHDIVADANLETVNQIEHFVSTASDHQEETRILAAFIVNDPGAASSNTLLGQLTERLNRFPANIVVSLTAANAPNLKTLLKTLIQRATASNVDSEDEDDSRESRRKGPKLLNYDLQILHDWYKAQDAERIIVIFEDTEAFDVNVLGEGFSLLRSWLDRIPFVLLCCVSTPLGLFEDRLPRSAARCVQGQVFHTSNSEDVLEDVFAKCVISEATVRLGPGISSFALQRSKEYGYGIEEFSKVVKYAYMCHFYGNPLSIFLAEKLQYKAVTAAHFEAVRNLPSFRSHCEQLLNDDVTRVKRLLDSDQSLFSEIVEQIEAATIQLSQLSDCLGVVQEVHNCLSSDQAFQPSTMYIRALNGELQQSPTIRELLLSVKKASSDTLRRTMTRLQDKIRHLPNTENLLPLETLITLQNRLELIIQESGAVDGPLRGEHEVRNDTYKTTVVGHRVGLSKQPSTTSKQHSKYSKLVFEFHDLLERLFSSSFFSMKDLFLHEILFYDFKSPHRDAFTPRPRFAVERALSSPHDYLGCNCCAENKESLTPTQPATAILYKLYLESGALINAFDLWSAFNAIVGEQYEDEQTTMALFFRALAELRHMGMIKSSRKRVDHLTKLQWKGL